MSFILWNITDVDTKGFVCFVSLITFLDQKEKKKKSPKHKNKEKWLDHKIPKTETKLIEWRKTRFRKLQ